MKTALFFSLLYFMNFLGAHNPLNINNVQNLDLASFGIYLVTWTNIDELESDYKNNKWKNFVENSQIYDVVVSDNDIDQYNWTMQTLKLTKQASDRIIEKISKDPWYIADKQFIVMLNGKRIYGWSIIDPISARWINYPVIYSNINSSVRYKFDDILTGIVAFEISPFHSVVTKYSDIPNEEKKLIEVKEIKEHLTKKWKLVETIEWIFAQAEWNYGVIKNIFLPNMSPTDIKNYLGKFIRATGYPALENWSTPTDTNSWALAQSLTGQRTILNNAVIEIIEENDN